MGWHQVTEKRRRYQGVHYFIGVRPDDDEQRWPMKGIDERTTPQSKESNLIFPES